MKTLAFVLAATLASAAFAPAAFAQDRAPAPPAQAAPQQTADASQSGPAVTAPLGRDGQNTSNFCSKENPNIEYRDCVNASTRDLNAKVRMG